MFDYKVKITRVVDGDTVDAELDLGFDIIYRERIRLMAIDTPESRTRNKVEKALGLAAKARLKELIAENKGNIILKTAKTAKGKFGRILGNLYTEEMYPKTFNYILIEEGHAREYYGGSKDELGPWTKYEENVEGITAGGWYKWTHGGYKLIE